MKLKIKITTLSDTLIGSGRTYGAVIDSDIEYDNYGMPYIPSKRIKGIFRDAANELLKMDGLNGLLGYELKDIDEIFGNIGSTENGSYLKFDNLNIVEKEQIAPWLDYLFLAYEYHFKDNIMQDFFTSIRNQTAIDKDKGIAKDGSLRTLRLLKEGFAFDGELYIDNYQYDKKIKRMLAFISLIIKRIGTQRNRGFGKVDIDLYDEHGKSLKDELKRELEDMI